MGPSAVNGNVKKLMMRQETEKTRPVLHNCLEKDFELTASIKKHNGESKRITTGKIIHSKKYDPTILGKLTINMP